MLLLKPKLVAASLAHSLQVCRRHSLVAELYDASFMSLVELSANICFWKLRCFFAVSEMRADILAKIAMSNLSKPPSFAW